MNYHYRFEDFIHEEVVESQEIADIPSQNKTELAVADPAKPAVPVRIPQKKRSAPSAQSGLKCDVCNKEFQHGYSLKSHMRVHTGEKPYACDQCDYKCSTSGSMRRHSRIHTGEKLYACEQCDFKCITSSHLKFHVATHARNKK